MSDERNGAPIGQRNDRVPSGARRVLMFGYYDGALDGVLESDDGDVFRFDSLAEPEDLVRRKSRSYILRPLPNDALDHLAAVIAPHIQPRWPAWMPVWDFPDEATRSDVEARTDAILDQAGPVTWEITTDDYHSFAQFTAKPVQVVPAAGRD